MEANSLVQHPVKRGRFERRLCPDASLRSANGRLRKAASLAQTSPLGTEGERHSACGQIRSLKRLPSDPCYVAGLPADFGFAAFRGEFGPPSTWRRTKRQRHDTRVFGRIMTGFLLNTRL